MVLLVVGLVLIFPFWVWTGKDIPIVIGDKTPNNQSYQQELVYQDDEVVVVAPPPEKEFTCAPWIPAEKRKILMHSMLHRFASWEDHQDGLSNHIEGYVKGGEPYWSACIHRALVDLGFEVEITKKEIHRL